MSPHLSQYWKSFLPPAINTLRHHSSQPRQPCTEQPLNSVSTSFCLEEQRPPRRTLPEEAGESSNTGCGSSNCCSNVVNLFQSQWGDQELYRLSLSVSLMTARKRSLCMFFNYFGPFFRHFQF